MREASLNHASPRSAEAPGFPGRIRVADTLVHALADGGAWPPPDLLDAIAAQGEHAVLPLAGYIRGALMGVRPRDPLVVAIRLLGAIPCNAALTTLLPLLRECCGEYLEAAAEAVSRFGPEASGRALAIAADESLPLSNRVAALDAASETAKRSGQAARRVGGELHGLLRAELDWGERMTRPQKQWAAAVVESVCSLGYAPAAPDVRAAIDCGIAWPRDPGVQGREPDWRPSVDHVDCASADPAHPSFPARYRGEFNMRSLRASSLARACKTDLNDLDGWSADYRAPG